MVRQKILSQLVDIIVSFNPFHPLRVAIDGIDNAGKTTLANELAPLIEQRGRAVIRASIDGFHRPRQERYSRGPDSAEGYYEDSFDYTTLREELLVPLGPDGNLHYRSATFDVRRDISLSTPERVASPNAILLFDGVFLLRPELVEQWDYRLFVEVTMEEALRRAMKRDLPLFGTPEGVQARYLQRYFPGQQLYFQAVHPRQRADVVVENNNPAYPRLIFPLK